MKKLIMALALIASMVTVTYGSTDTYKFSSTMRVYSLKHQSYKTTSFNGTLVVDTDTGYMTLTGLKKDTKEAIEMTLDTGAVTTNGVGDAFDCYAIVSGKKNKVGASTLKFVSEEDNLVLYMSGNGAVKTTKSGCGTCGDFTTCTKVKTLKGAYVGSYDCGCQNGQHYEYDFSCDLPEDKDLTKCPVWGTWSATLKSSVD